MGIADDLVEAHEVWLTPDLETYLRVVGSMFTQVELYTEEIVVGDEVLDGWAMLLDPDRAPAAALPYLAQYVGEHLPVGLDVAGQREWIKDAPNQFRGTLMSLVRAAQRTLTGQRSVRIKPRAGVGGADDPNRLIVNTFTSETPNSAAVYADLLTVVPVDIDLVYSVISGQTWGDVNTTYASWAAVSAANSSWEIVRLTLPAGYTSWTRPRS